MLEEGEKEKISYLIGKISVYKHLRQISFDIQNCQPPNKPYVSASNKALVGTLISIGDVIDIFAIDT